MYILINVTLNLLRIIEIIIIARCILSFIPQLKNNQFVKLIIWVTEPVLLPARLLLKKFMPNDAPPIDFSPILTYLFLIVIRIIFTSVI